jgi:hypothetical protein
MDIGAPIFRGIGFVGNNGACFESNWRRLSLNVSMFASGGIVRSSFQLYWPLHLLSLILPRLNRQAVLGTYSTRYAPLPTCSSALEIGSPHRSGHMPPQGLAHWRFRIYTTACCPISTALVDLILTPPLSRAFSTRPSGLFPYSISLFSLCRLRMSVLCPCSSSDAHFSISFIHRSSLQITTSPTSLSALPRTDHFQVCPHATCSISVLTTPPFHIRPLIDLPNLVLTLPRPNRYYQIILDQVLSAIAFSVLAHTCSLTNL